MLSLPATLTHAHATACLDTLTTGLKQESAAQVVVNAALLRSFDSSALAVLLEFRRECARAGKRFVVQGLPDPTQGTIDAPIGRHPNHDYKFAVLAGGKASITHYVVIEAFRSASLVEVHLETGRTHQIRVHFSALRHPCAGDLTYGADPVLAKSLGLERQWLHAVGLGFQHPGSGERVDFRSAYPADLQIALDRVGG